MQRITYDTNEQNCRAADGAVLPEHICPFLIIVHQFDATQNDARAVEILEPEHRSRSAFDGPMVLFDDVVQILDLTTLDGCLALGRQQIRCFHSDKTGY